jgi:hypothetical protein
MPNHLVLGMTPLSFVALILFIAIFIVGIIDYIEINKRR